MYLTVTLSTGKRISCHSVKDKGIDDYIDFLNSASPKYIRLETISKSVICINTNAIVSIEFSDGPLPV